MILPVKAVEFFPVIHFFKDIRAKWPASNLAARYIFNLDFYHITVCTVIRVYIYLKNGNRIRRNGALLSETFVDLYLVLRRLILYVEFSFYLHVQTALRLKNI